MRGGAPSWYDGVWSQGRETRRKSLVCCREWRSGQGSGATTASASASVSTEGGKDVTAGRNGGQEDQGHAKVLGKAIQRSERTHLGTATHPGW